LAVLGIQMQGGRIHGEGTEQQVVGLGHGSPHQVLEALPDRKLLEIKSRHPSMPSSIGAAIGAADSVAQPARSGQFAPGGGPGAAPACKRSGYRALITFLRSTPNQTVFRGPQRPAYSFPHVPLR